MQKLSIVPNPPNKDEINLINKNNKNIIPKISDEFERDTSYINKDSDRHLR